MKCSDSSLANQQTLLSSQESLSRQQELSKLQGQRVLDKVSQTQSDFDVFCVVFFPVCEVERGATVLRRREKRDSAGLQQRAAVPGLSSEPLYEHRRHPALLFAHPRHSVPLAADVSLGSADLLSHRDSGSSGR